MKFSLSVLLIFIVFAIVHVPNKALCLEVILVLQDGSKQKGDLKEIKDDGTIVLKNKYGEFTFKPGQYKNATTSKAPIEFSTADGLFRRKEYSKAQESYQATYDKYKWLNWGERALEGVGNCQKAQKKYTEAIGTYEIFAKQYPDSVNLPRVRYNKGTAHQALGENNKALKEYSAIAETVDDIFTVYALSNAGKIQYDNKEYEEALRSSLMIIILYDGIKNAEGKIREAKGLAGKCYDALIEKNTSKETRKQLLKEKERITK